MTFESNNESWDPALLNEALQDYPESELLAKVKSLPPKFASQLHLLLDRENLVYRDFAFYESEKGSSLVLSDVLDRLNSAEVGAEEARELFDLLILEITSIG